MTPSHDLALRVELLPAGKGDALLVTAPLDNGGEFRMLVDTGEHDPALAAIKRRLEDVPIDRVTGKRHLDLLVVTHIDEDHIENACALLDDEALALDFDDIWFNGRAESFGSSNRAVSVGAESVGQADDLTRLLVRRDLPHNRAFSGEPAEVPGDVDGVLTPESGTRPSTGPGAFRQVTRDGEAPVITILSPLPQDLRALRADWLREVATHGVDASARDFFADAESREGVPVPVTVEQIEALAAQEFTPEETRANICSIVLLVEHRGCRLLLTGDGHPYVYEPALRALARHRGEDALTLDAVKVAHHGSADNTSRELKDFGASTYLISTNGAKHDHPDSESLSRLICGAPEPPTFYFNFSTPRVREWAATAERVGSFGIVQPPEGSPGMVVDLPAR